ncbi:TolC family protein [Henriciella mobilis]|uniref:TolC family protein n=1 Tax=Henriciella mobilis TaxID=2305467 RepID=UPI000E6763FC|nr:TolC family protein [Henriciella mobilis]RIJ15715.1 TolC family protein [Henriciella mobilis]RIJ19179.1 TolC family protein [Henriciella mobilis]
MKYLLAIALYSLGVASAAAQSYLPAEELVQDALDSHPSLSVAKAGVLVAQSEARGLAVGPYEWTISAGYTQRVIENQFGFNEFDAELTKGFRRRGKATLDREIGTLGIEAARLSNADQRHEIALELATLWIEWLAKEEQLAIALAQVGSFEASVNTVERRLRANDASLLELELAQTALAEARTAAASVTGNVETAKRRLGVMFPDLPLPGNPLLLKGPENIENLERWRSLIIERSHEIELAETKARLASVVARRSRQDLKPDFEAGLRTFSERNGNEAGLGIVVSIPLGGAKRSAALERDTARSSLAMADLALKHREIEAMAQTDVALAQSSIQAWQAALSAKQTSSAAITRLRRGFELGDIRLSELLIAERRHVDIVGLEASARARSAYAVVRLRINAHDLWLRRGYDEAGAAVFD